MNSLPKAVYFADVVELALGELLVDSGREDEAEAFLERSRQTFTRLGAKAWLARRAARVG